MSMSIDVQKYSRFSTLFLSRPLFLTVTLYPKVVRISTFKDSDILSKHS